MYSITIICHEVLGSVISSYSERSDQIILEVLGHSAAILAEPRNVRGEQTSS